MKGSGYYYGSYGLVRGYGPLCRTLKEADATVIDDSRAQRKNGGSCDRVVVLVSPNDGLCWWAEDDEDQGSRLDPVWTPGGVQARYEASVIAAHEELWLCPKELPGFG
jgi:hypothetical protein